MTYSIRQTHSKGSANVVVPFTVAAVGGETLITIVSITEASASAKTNEVVTFGLPLSATALPDNILVYDDNGSGAKGSALANFQVDNIASDLNSKKRFAQITGIVPSLGSGATRKLHVYNNSASLPTGTAITATDILATSYSVKFTGTMVPFKDASTIRTNTFATGTTAPFYTAVLDAGASGSDDFYNGNIIICSNTAETRVITDYVGSTKTVTVDFPWNAGTGNTFTIKDGSQGSGTAYTVSARDALGGSGTWDKADEVTHGNWRSGPCCTEIVCSAPLLAGATPYESGDGLRAWFHISAYKAGTGAVTGGNPITYIRTRIIIENGAIDRASAKVSDFLVYDGIVERSTSLSSGTLISTDDTDVDGNTITYDFPSSYSHWYGGRFSRLVHVGTKPTNMFAYGSVADATNADETAHRAYMISTRLLPNYVVPASSIDHSDTIDNYLDLTPRTTPFKTLVSGGLNTGRMGVIAMFQNAGGERGEIGLYMIFSIAGVTKWDVDGRRNIFEHAEYLNTYPTGCLRCYSTPPTGAGGGFNRPDSTSYKLNPAHTGTQINFPTNLLNPWAVDSAHQPEHGCMAYILTGDVYYLEMQGSQLGRTHASWAGGFGQGDGINRTPYSDTLTTTLSDETTGVWIASVQQREQAWQHRYIVAAGLLTPDDKTDDKIVMSKTILQTWNQNTNTAAWNRANFHTGSGSERYSPNGDGPRWTSTGGSPDYPTWQLGFAIQVWCWAADCGMNDSNADNFIEWIGSSRTSAYSSPDVAPDHITAMFFLATVDRSGNPIKTWADTYQSAMQESSRNNPGIGALPRVNSGTMTLSATSGASVSVTLPSALLGQTSWYVHGWIEGTGGVGFGRITAVADASHCTIDTTVAANDPSVSYSGNGGAAFASTSITGFHLPAPHPLDAAADGTATENNVNYQEIYRSVCAMLTDRGLSGAQAAYDYMEAYYPGINSVANFKWWIEPR